MPLAGTLEPYLFDMNCPGDSDIVIQFGVNFLDVLGVTLPAALNEDCTA
jgi:hypothetical protein